MHFASNKSFPRKRESFSCTVHSLLEIPAYAGIVDVHNFADRIEYVKSFEILEYRA